MLWTTDIYGWTIRKLKLGGGGWWGAKYKKKYSRKEKLDEKNSCTPVNPKKYSRYGLKKFLRLKIPHSPHNFSNGPSHTKALIDRGKTGYLSVTSYSLKCPYCLK